MNYQVPILQGIDFYVQGLQDRWYRKAKSLWGVTDDTYNCFGRAYRNKTEDGYIPEFLDPTTGQYVDGGGVNAQGGLFYQDTLSAMSFFAMSDPQKRDPGVYGKYEDTAYLQWLFFVDLSKITPGGITNAQGQRLDEVCINDVRNYVQSNGNGFTVHDTFRDIDKVLERFSGAQKLRALLDDMHPKYCFRIDLELRYNPLIKQQNNNLFNQ